MDLVYDNIVFAIQKYGGISVVWQELLQRQQQIGDFKTKYVDVDNAKFKNYSRNKLQIEDQHIIRTIQYPKLERYVPVRVNADTPFLFHSSYYRYCTNPKAINITTVHDFTYELYIKGIKRLLHSWQKFSAIRHSSAVVCISENTKHDLLRLMPDIDEAKVRVIYNGVSDAYGTINSGQLEGNLPFPSKSYVVFIGRRDNYKNFDLTVRCVAATVWNLLIVGSPLNEDESRILDRMLPKNRYVCLSQVPDTQLNVFYNYAAALVYPSSYEGFGLPVLEAQRAGCPVVAYHASSIPEIIGHTPLLMIELSEREFIEKLNLLSNESLMTAVTREGVVNSNRFSWDKMVQQYTELYHEMMTK